MDPAQYQKIKEIVASLLEVDCAARSARLTEMCGSDRELRREVESLLQADEDAEDFLDNPAYAETETAAAPQNAPTAGGWTIGPYRVVREIGSGGMGIVYEAVREDEIRKKVAVKLVKPGMDTALVLKRFRSERRISAALHHPNITMLLDGGATADQRPYFAMEFVEGIPIDAYCRTHSLPLRQILELFRTVCGAVHYAHQNLVVHRDLKPSNILVTRDGVPKLLDFGIAKILGPLEASGTVAGLTAAMPMMTPDYASPEQARGASVTTSTDIYSLGAVLYELLTGKRPHRFPTSTPQQIVEVICEQEPIAPSEAAANRDLRGDLDNIVLKAMQKEPLRRYGSAEDLSQDMERFLLGMPVRARKDTITYRASKFVRRHRAGVFAASLVLIALTGGIIATARQARIAARERDRAERRFADVRKLANTLVFEVHDAIRNLPGATAARELLLRRGMEYLDKLNAEAPTDNLLRTELAGAYQRLGPAFQTLGDFRASVDARKKALAIRESLAAAQPDNVEAKINLADAYITVTTATSYKYGQGAEKRVYAQKAMEIAEQATKLRPADSRVRRTLASAYDLMSGSFFIDRDYKSAIEWGDKAFVITKELAEAAAATTVEQRSLAGIRRNLGFANARAKQFDTAIEHFQGALTIQETLAKNNPNDSSAQYSVAQLWFDQGLAAHEPRGDWPAAARAYERALALHESSSAADPKNSLTALYVALDHNRLGDVLLQMKQNELALAHHRKAVQLQDELVRRAPPTQHASTRQPDYYLALGSALASVAKFKGQPQLCREALLWLEKSEVGYNKAKAEPEKAQLGQARETCQAILNFNH